MPSRRVESKNDFKCTEQKEVEYEQLARVYFTRMPLNSIKSELHMCVCKRVSGKHTSTHLDWAVLFSCTIWASHSNWIGMNSEKDVMRCDLHSKDAFKSVMSLFGVFRCCVSSAEQCFPNLLAIQREKITTSTLCDLPSVYYLISQVYSFHRWLKAFV